MITKSSILFLVSTLIFASFGLSLDSFAQTPEQSQSPIHAPDRLIVKFKPGVSPQNQNALLSLNSATTLNHLPLLDLKIISVPEQTLDAVKNALSKNNLVEFAEYDIAVPPSSIPNDPSYGNQWYLPMINAPDAYDITHGNGPPIVILDSGIDMDHSDLSSKIIYPYNGLTQVAGPVDHQNGCGHGTPVAGSAAAITNNANGVAGVGWDTQIIPVKITDDNASGPTQCYGWSNGVLKGVEWAVNHNAKVVNLSYGFGASGSILTAAQLMQDNGGWLVISAGNDYGQITKADDPRVIFVSSTTSSDTLSSFSSYGDFVDMSGPGSSILSPVDGNGYSYVSGTSFAAPITAAALNLLYSVDPTLTSSESFDILKNSAVDLGTPGWDIQYGHGRVDAGAAVLEASNSTPPNFKVAFIGDQGLGGDSESVLTLINNENVDMVLHQGDFDYLDNPTAWDNQINTFLPGVPYFASVGNHDMAQWSGYQQVLQNRLNNIPGATCTGDLGVKSACHYQGLFFILSGVGTHNSYSTNDYVTHLQTELANDNSIWSICSWHKNQNAMQVGGKTDEVGWGAYEACKDGGAIIATAHEHSYERTKSLTSTTNQIVDPAWTEPGEVRVAEGSTFVFVSGLGGQSIRDQERCLPTSYPYGCNGEWANIYTSNQGAQSGALFCEFNVNGQKDKATCFFKNISGQTIDTFNITSFMGVEIPQEPPVAYNQSVSTFENVPIDITLSATDANGDPLTYSIVAGPTSGSLSGTSPDLTYTPDLDYSGNDSFTFKANDGISDSNIATVSITVDPIPASGTLDIRVGVSSDDAEQQIATGVMDLSSTDIEIGDDPGHNEDQLAGLRFTNIILPQGATIVSAHIELETDEVDSVSTSVTIRAQDSDDSSTFTSTQNNISNRPTTVASVSWSNIPAWDTVSEKHNTPDISSLVQEVANRPGWIPGNSMTFIIDGTGSRTAESFNGESDNAPLLHIEYSGPQTNNPPVANSQSLITDEDTVLPITLTATDDDGDPLTYSVVTNPSNGFLSGTAPNLNYNPNSNFNGADSFTFKANDGTDDSNIATVSITVNAINDAPVADPQSVSTDEDVALPIILTASDVDGDSLGFTVVSPPSNGGLSGSAPNLTYTPNSGFDGNDSFTFKADDGTLDSNIATVSITVNSINSIHLENITGESNTKKNWKATVTLTVFDSGENPFSGALVSGNWEGGPSENCTTDSQGQCQVSETSRAASQTFTVVNISGSGINYDPASNHNGDSITINQDGSTPGPNVPPTAVDDTAETTEDVPVNIDVLANDSDANGDSLTIESFTQGTNGSVVDNGNGILTYNPILGFFGSDSFSYTINDGNGETANANVNVTVNEETPTVPVHIDSIVMTSTSANGPFWNAIATITVVDSANIVQSGVVVSADWSGSMSGSDSCITDSLGQCSITDKSKSTLDAIFTVTNLSGVGFVYDSTVNVETSDSISPP